ncbi:hypothetical protein TrLO_g5079 [Triparma laevis f. longispina]|uniref:Alpha-L-glutamate ligase-related protein ATP-grasp domain-containing protein n=1 Tax=Triparma laevis f. longispina TaxID=1714387 RepID=A0A9W7DND6_9STRA|nr:hypothetical protein TrLO_g5079 [Triparma laevis f. longispina]
MVSRSRSPSREKPASGARPFPSTPPSLPSPPVALLLYLSTLLPLLLPSSTLSPLLSKPHALSKTSLTYIYQLTLPIKHWSTPHYRKGTYQQDLLDNLVNVAIPGTGLPLKFFVLNRLFYVGFLIFIIPLLLVVQDLHLVYLGKERQFSQNLLGYNLDWCSLWRINCNLAHLHSLKTGDKGYDMENKWEFILKCEEENIPISPTMEVPGICIKHKNEEGGLGIHFYKSARAGGDWIIQKVIKNSDFVSSLLPDNSPLSTFRVMTLSEACKKSGTKSKPVPSDFETLSCVFRAGREGALTDHDSILFNVDLSTGIIGPGTVNKNWYQTYKPGGELRSGDKTFTSHPDNSKLVTGSKIKNIKQMLNICEEAHMKALPGVPMVGWDVVLCDEDSVEGGICLLEVNLSCNFFRGIFDEPRWWRFVQEVIVEMEKR